MRLNNACPKVSILIFIFRWLARRLLTDFLLRTFSSAQGI